MAKKIYPNDPCPCGSKLKYKECCGSNKPYIKTDLQLVDFVIERLNEDISFLASALRVVLGTAGYRMGEKYKDLLFVEYKKDGFEELVEKDLYKVYQIPQELRAHHIKEIRPYGGGAPSLQHDLLTLIDEGYVRKDYYQVELFHSYLIHNLKKRFNKYHYVPKNQSINFIVEGPFGHRGYDFLVGITLYLELQLGVHIYYDDETGITQEEEKEIRKQFGLKDIAITNGMFSLLRDYSSVITELERTYDIKNDVNVYNAEKLYTQEQFVKLKEITEPGYYPFPYDYNYSDYLRSLVAATCFNSPTFYEVAKFYFPQCDFVKYITSLGMITTIFEDKTVVIKNDPENLIDISKLIQGQGERKLGFSLEKTELSQIDLYHSVVFNLCDEINGVFYSSIPKQMKYIDKEDDINRESYSDIGMNINPARKTTRRGNYRKLLIELYNVFNGLCFELMLGDHPGGTKNPKVFLKYPMLPWLSRGTEDTVHINECTGSEGTIFDIYSPNLNVRQTLLTMEYRLTEIPVNCIEEFLIPSVFYDWKEKHDLLKELERKNIILNQRNVQLSRHIHLNQELIRNLSHSSANYLNAENLLQTGKTLKSAYEGNPSIETLHAKGVSLILHSEQEEHLLRQLNSLIWRCSADSAYLTEQIRKGLASKGRMSITEPVLFSLRTIASRLLFRNNDIRSQFIKKKLNKADENWLSIQSSFIFDILANDDNNEISWWNGNICNIEVTYSDVWRKLHIIEEGSFFDLITEIITEQVLNALSHGDLKKPIKICMGQAEEFRGRPKWAYILCSNHIGEPYLGSKRIGISTLNESIRLINSGKRGIDVDITDNAYQSKVWLLSSLLKPLQ